MMMMRRTPIFFSRGGGPPPPPLPLLHHGYAADGHHRPQNPSVFPEGHHRGHHRSEACSPPVSVNQLLRAEKSKKSFDPTDLPAGNPPPQSRSPA
jgi:hypothetical protein